MVALTHEMASNVSALTLGRFKAFNASIGRWTNPPWRTIHLSRRSRGEGGTNPLACQSLGDGGTWRQPASCSATSAKSCSLTTPSTSPSSNRRPVARRSGSVFRFNASIRRWTNPPSWPLQRLNDPLAKAFGVQRFNESRCGGLFLLPSQFQSPSAFLIPTLLVRLRRCRQRADQFFSQRIKLISCPCTESPQMRHSKQGLLWISNRDRGCRERPTYKLFDRAFISADYHPPCASTCRRRLVIIR